MAVRKMSAFEELAALGRRVRTDHGLTRTDGVEEMVAFAEFWQRELPELTERWRRTRQEAREGT